MHEYWHEYDNDNDNDTSSSSSSSRHLKYENLPFNENTKTGIESKSNRIETNQIWVELLPNQSEGIQIR